MPVAGFNLGMMCFIGDDVSLKISHVKITSTAFAI
jgi:hypothetical protein